MTVGRKTGGGGGGRGEVAIMILRGELITKWLNNAAFRRTLFHVFRKGRKVKMANTTCDNRFDSSYWRSLSNIH